MRRGEFARGEREHLRQFAIRQPCNRARTAASAGIDHDDAADRAKTRLV